MTSITVLWFYDFDHFRACFKPAVIALEVTWLENSDSGSTRRWYWNSYWYINSFTDRQQIVSRLSAFHKNSRKQEVDSRSCCYQRHDEAKGYQLCAMGWYSWSVSRLSNQKNCFFCKTAASFVWREAPYKCQLTPWWCLPVNTVHSCRWRKQQKKKKSYKENNWISSQVYIV